jgi:hypothetical protein
MEILSPSLANDTENKCDPRSQETMRSSPLGDPLRLAHEIG